MNTIKIVGITLQIAGASLFCVSMFLIGLVTFAVYELGTGVLSYITRKRHVPFFELLMRMCP